MTDTTTTTSSDQAQNNTTSAGVVNTDSTATTLQTTAGKGGNGTNGATSVLGTETEDKTMASPSDWPSAWRELYAGEDKKLLGRLERYASPKAAFDALIAAQDRIRSGDLQKVLPENPSDEELSAWREANGVPLKPEDYQLTLAEGRQIGTDDKPMIDDFVSKMHGLNAKPELVSAAVDAYYDAVEKNIAAREAKDQEVRQSVEDALRVEFGSEYRRNINLVNNFLNLGPPGVREKLLGARLADGTPLGSDIDVIRYFTQLALDNDLVTTVVPGSGAQAVSAIDDELGRLTKMMGDHSSEYWRGPQAAQNQKRFLELTEAKEKMKRRA